MNKKPTVLIIGGGLGGLVLAQALRKQNIPFKVFERDSNDHSRVQGWAITLSVAVPGLLQDLPDDMPPLANVSISKNLGTVGVDFNIYNGTTGEKFPVAGFKGPVEIGSAEGNMGAPLRGNRKLYREWLTHNLEIHWNKRFTHYTEGPNEVTAYFTDGSSYTGDVLVGADGSNSKVRSQLLGENFGKSWVLPYPCIIANVTLDEEATKRNMALSKGMYLVKGSKASYFCSYRSVEAGMKSSEWYWFMFWEDAAFNKADYWLKTATQQQMLERAHELTDDVKPELKDLITRATVDDVSKHPLEFREFFTPFGLPSDRTTLVGDALHTMPPFRGVGANSASLDSLELASTITQAARNGSSLVEAMKPYAARAAKRGHMLVRESHDVGLHIDAKTQATLYEKAIARAQGGDTTAN